MRVEKRGLIRVKKRREFAREFSQLLWLVKREWELVKI